MAIELRVERPPRTPEEFAGAIWDLIARYRESDTEPGITYRDMVGVLEFIKYQLVDEAMKKSEEDD